jgi:hypothetical protein
MAWRLPIAHIVTARAPRQQTPALHATASMSASSTLCRVRLSMSAPAAGGGVASPGLRLVHTVAPYTSCSPQPQASKVAQHRRPPLHRLAAIPLLHTGARDKRAMNTFLSHTA